jgi:aminopeptidase
MLNETHLERYADVILWGLKTAKKGRIKKNDIILIRFDLPALRLVEILYEKLIRMNVHPLHRLLQTPDMEKKAYLLSNSTQLTFIPPGEDALYKNLNGGIYILAPESLTHLSSIDPMKISSALKARKFLRDILDRREEERAFSWTLCMFPTEELARHANLSLEEYARQVAGACFLDRQEPVRHWEEIYQNAQTIKKWLNRMKVKNFHIESESVDLVVTPGKKRKWIGISGHNIPSFELFLSPDWRGTNGIYYADQPSYRSGNYIKDIRIEFKDGIARRSSAEKGDKFLKKQLAMDNGANKIGEFSLTDKTFSKIRRFMANTLYDENFGGKFGNCHIALGASYSDTYSGDPSQLTKEIKEDLGFNDSALHWDIVNTQKKRVTAHLSNGKACVIYENGSFTY